MVNKKIEGTGLPKKGARSRKKYEPRYLGPQTKDVVRAAVASKRSAQKRKEQRGHTVGYRAPAQDPVLAGDPDLTMVTGGITPLAKQAAHKRVTLPGKKAFLIIFIIVCVLALLWLIAWTNRPISFKLNGADAVATVNTPITQIMQERKISVEPGNLVSVTGQLIETGKGDAFSLSINGNTMPYQEVLSYKIIEQADIVVSNGANVTENYELTYEAIAPKLAVEGESGALMYIAQWPREGSKEIRHGLISGETTYGDVYKEPQDCIVKLRNITPDNNRKAVALTFNAATVAQLRSIAEALDQAHVPGTVFVSGNDVSSMRDVLARLSDAGNQVASLSSNFQHLNVLSSQDLQNDLASAFTSLESVTHKASTIIRPPYGQFSASAWLGSKGLVSVAVLWNQDGSINTYKTAQSITDAATNALQPGNIILVSDGGANANQEIQAIPKIVAKLKENGYEILTVDELMETDSSIPHDIATGSATLPQDCTWPDSLR